MLFVIAVDELVRVAKRLCERNLMRGFSLRDGTSIPLLQYADDTIFFIGVGEMEARRMRFLIFLFGEASGLQINLAKSDFVPFNLTEAEARGCSLGLGTKQVKLPIRYLGLPLTDGRILVRDWAPLVERLEGRLEGWASRLLSRGGRLVLLKAVLSAMPSYFTSVLKMPRQVVGKIERFMRNFFWSNQETNGPGARLVAWEEVCRSLEDGGLGVRDLGRSNGSLLEKWVGSLLEGRGNLVGKVFETAYGGPVRWDLLMSPPRDASHFLKGLSTVAPRVRNCFVPVVGTGEIFRFWQDDWTGNGALARRFQRLFALS
jgi:hypothetical protein